MKSHLMPILLLTTLLMTMLVTWSWAQPPPVLVSPGSDEGSEIADICPTFLWGSVAEAEGFRLVVYRVREEGSELEIRVEKAFEGSVNGWTPSLDSCLARGESYAWAVRTLGEDDAGDWSAPRLFRVIPSPADAAAPEAAQARKALETRGTREAATRRGEEPPRHDVAVGTRTETGDTTDASRVVGRTHVASTGGIVVNGVAAETQADPGCFPAEGDADDVDRFIDCGNGTVHDTVTGLLWLKDANCLAGAEGQGDDGTRTWYEANAFAQELAEGQCGLTDHSQASDWRLPTEAEWEGVLDGSCSTDPELAGKSGGCYDPEPWATNVQNDPYWAATTRADGPSIAKTGDLPEGFVAEGFKNASVHVWPVRDSE